MVTITAKRAGFRRCGISHPAAPVSYPDDKFSAAELAALQTEPMLVVRVEADKTDETAGQSEQAEEIGQTAMEPHDVLAGKKGKK